MDHFQHDHRPSFWKSPGGLALLVAVLVGGFYLVTEHQAHLYGVLPYLFLLACPLMHLFMHRGHHHGGHRDRNHRSDQNQGAAGESRRD